MESYVSVSRGTRRRGLVHSQSDAGCGEVKSHDGEQERCRHVHSHSVGITGKKSIISGQQRRVFVHCMAGVREKVCCSNIDFRLFFFLSLSPLYAGKQEPTQPDRQFTVNVSVVCVFSTFFAARSRCVREVCHLNCRRTGAERSLISKAPRLPLKVVFGSILKKNDQIWTILYFYFNYQLSIINYK